MGTLGDLLEQRPRKREVKEMRTGICPLCGKAWQSWNKTKKYCSFACGEAAKLAHNRRKLSERARTQP